MERAKTTLTARTTATLTVLGLIAAMAAIPAPASADFHPVCTGMVTAYANVDLVQDPTTGEMSYSGAVNCPDTVVTIQEVELVHHPAMAGPDQLANVTGEACEASLTQPCYPMDGVESAPMGILTVHMTFDVDDPATDGVDFPGIQRNGTWMWFGMGQPVPLCRSLGFVPISVGSC